MGPRLLTLEIILLQKRRVIHSRVRQSLFFNPFQAYALFLYPLKSSEKCDTSFHKYPSTNQLTCFYMVRTLTEKYLRTDHNACSKTPFIKNLYHIETSHLICIANQMAGFSMAQVFTERYFRTDTAVCSELRFSKNRSIEKPGY